MQKSAQVSLGFAVLVIAAASGWALRQNPMRACRVASKPCTASSTVEQFQSPAPAVSFQIHLADQEGRISMPPPVDLSNQHLNADGVWAIFIGGAEYTHIADISAQASGMGNDDVDLDGALKKASELTPQQRAALDWLDRHQIALEGDAVVWHYTFPHVFNDLAITSSWPSSFAQADAIKALLLAHFRTGEKRFLRLALRAGYAFGVPCEHGGLRCEVGGVPWFEEVPVPNGFAPMILNGHLYSVVLLHRLWTATGDRRIKDAFDEGLASARTMLLHYDTGYWSEYQLRPRVLNVMFQIDPAGSPMELREATIKSSVSSPSSIFFGSKGKRTFRSSSFVGNISASNATGSSVTGPVTLTLLPGPLTQQQDLPLISGFDILVRYVAADCTEARFATFDWRSTSHRLVSISNMKGSSSGGECLATGRLPNSINQWSTLTPFYHDWHTRLLIELWRITGDAKLYSTAVRWRRYAEEELRNRTAEGNSFFEPIFNPIESDDEDHAIFRALKGRSPDALSAEDVRTALEGLFQSEGLDEPSRRSILARAGLRQS